MRPTRTSAVGHQIASCSWLSLTQAKHEDYYFTAAHLGEGDGIAASTFIGETRVAFDLANRRHRLAQVAVPIDGIPGEIEMRVEDNHDA